MTYVRPWHSLLIAFTVATWGLAQPLYSFAITNDLFRSLTIPAILLFMLSYQALPTAAVFLVDRGIIRYLGAGTALGTYRGLLFVASTLVFLRATQLALPSINSLAVELKLSILGSAIAILLVLILLFNRATTLLFLYLSAASLITTAVFVAQTDLLNSTRGASSTQEALVQRQSLRPLVLVIFDGLGLDILLRDGDIDPNRYPNFAELGRDSVVFTNGTSNHWYSYTSIPAIMNGTVYPDIPTGPPGLGPDGLLSTLMEAGYQVDTYSEYFECVESEVVCRDKPHLALENPHLVALEYASNFAPKFITRSLPFLPVGSTHIYNRTLWNLFLSNISAPGVSDVEYQHVDLVLTVLEIMNLVDYRDRNGVSVFTSPRPTRDKVFLIVPKGETDERVIYYVYDSSKDRWLRSSQNATLGR